MSEDLKKFFEFLNTPEGKTWSQGSDPNTGAANVQPSWVPKGYTMYGDQKTGVTVPTGANKMDGLYRGGMMSQIPGENPYFPNGASSGNLSLGGSPAETGAPPSPQQPASGQGQGPGAPSSEQLKAFLEYLAGRAGNASPVGNPGSTPAYTSRPSGPSYGAVVQKGLL